MYIFIEEFLLALIVQFEAPPSQLECILPRMIMASSLFSDVAFLYRGKKGSREEVPVSSLDGEGKVLGLYFSAHWCPPCRSFTPKLAEWYSRLTTGPLKDKFEIVFVSSDKDEDSFDSYFDEMPWLALPFHEREHKVFSTTCKSLSAACSQLQYTYSYSCSTIATPMYMPHQFLPNSIIIAIILSNPWAVASTLIL